VPPIAIAAAAPTARVSVAHELVDEGARCAHARHRRAELGGLIRPDGEQQNGTCRSADQLSGDVCGGVAGGEVAAERERHGHGRVDVRPGKVSRGVDHDHDDEPEDEADPDGAQDAVVLRVGDDRTAAREYQRECRDTLGGGAAN
jgi:hypothetical protein